jgi:steroid delta-isomerase-like uncharacterized protein
MERQVHEQPPPTTDAITAAIDERWVRAGFARFNDRQAFFADPSGTWVERPRYRVIPEDLEMNTRDEVLAWFRRFFDALPDLHLDVEEVVVAGIPGRERATVRWRMTGTFSGGPLMGIAPTGHHIQLRGMDLIEIEDGRIAGNVIYYDGLAFARQVGMLPAAGSAGDRLIARTFNGLTAIRSRIHRAAS